MRRVRRLILTVLLGAVCAVAACEGRDDDNLSDADVTAIRAVGQAFASGIVAHDFDRVMAQRTDDIVWMVPNGPPLAGPAAVRMALDSGARATAFVITSERTEGSGNLAYDRGSYAYSAVMGGDTVTERGKYLQILRRQPDDTWRIALDMWSSNDAPPAPMPAPPPRRR